MSTFLQDENFAADFEPKQERWTNNLGSFGNNTKYEAFYLRDFHSLLEGSDRAIGWLHNTSYYWGNLGPVNPCIQQCIDDGFGSNISGLPFGVNDAVPYDDLRDSNPGDDELQDYGGVKLRIADLKPTKRYEIEWYNTRTGLSTGITEMDWSSPLGVAQFNIPTWDLTSGYGDLGFRVRRYKTSSMFTEADSTTNEALLDPIENINVTMYPNPASDWLQIESNILMHSASIFTVQGKLVDEFDVNNTIYRQRISLSTGYYIVYIRLSNGQTTTIKLCVIHP